jgi:peptidoglycan hydrolase-like protein with peptidoglycan-binding domain
MVGDIDAGHNSVSTDVSDHSARTSSSQDENFSHNTDDHSTGHNTTITSDSHNDSHNQTAGGNLTDSHAQQTNFGGTVINVPAGEEMTHHPDGSITMAPPHPKGNGGGVAHHPDYLRQGSHGPKVEHWQQQLNDVMQANLQINSFFDQHTEDATIAFQSDSGLTADGVVGPHTQDAMNARWRPGMGDQYGDQQQGPYHPSTHGPYDPSQHGAYHPETHGQFHPETHGQFNPYVHGQFNPEYHGQYNPYVHGEFNPEHHGQYDAQLHGQYHPDVHGQYQPDKHGQFNASVHGEYNEQMHGPHDPMIHGEIAIY